MSVQLALLASILFLAVSENSSIPFSLSDPKYASLNKHYIFIPSELLDVTEGNPTFPDRKINTSPTKIKSG